MRNLIKTPGKFLYKLVWLCCLPLLFACETEPVPQENILQADLGVKKNHNVVDVVTTHMNLEVQSTIASGWTTFRYNNSSHNPHFFVLQKLPGDKTVEDSKIEVVPVFQEGMDFIAAGDWTSALNTFGNLPGWFFEAFYTGGTGILSPGKTSEITVYLEPGNYVLECYVKSASGVFHSSIGMISGMKVNDESRSQDEPQPTMEVNISSTNGITFKDNIRPGKHLIKVFFEDQTVYTHFLGHDVHLVRLDDNADYAELNAWMNWTNPDGFKTPAPLGVEFLGGMQDLPNSSTGYFDAHLKPGTYAFIAEVPDPMSKNMFKVFTVPGK